MLFSALQMNSPVIIRYPKGGGEEKLPEEFTYLEPGRASVIREPARDAEQSAWLWALGDMIPLAESASELLEEKGIGAGVVNPRFVLPLDTDLLAQHSREAGAIVTLENGMASGGFGSVVEEQVCSRDNEAGIVKIGWPRSFIEHGKSSDLFERWDITPEAVCERVCKCLKRS
jgi:1-deoxy-D-xylulose-5-phosphate synthase